MFTYAGIPVFEHSLALERTNEPIRAHIEKPWMAHRVYHARVQKKWIKRFGYRMKPVIFRTPHGLFVHPDLMSQLRTALDG